MNWKLIISDLKDCGVTQMQIASLCGSSQGHISELLTGKCKQPNWQLGDALLKLHQQHCRKKAA